jgi:hypothetical protein
MNVVAEDSANDEDSRSHPVPAAIIPDPIVAEDALPAANGPTLENLLEKFVMYTAGAHEIAAHIVCQEAAQVNDQLCQIQDILALELVAPVSHDERDTILSQAARMKRMAELVKHIQESNMLLYNELLALIKPPSLPELEPGSTGDFLQKG